MFTPVFENVDTTKPFTLGDITVCNEDGVEFDNNSAGAGVVGMGKLRIQFMEAGEQKSISLDSSIQYRSSGYDTRDTNPDGWGWRDKRTVEVPSGTGIIVNNGLDSKIIFRVAGGVQLIPQVGIPKGYSIFGNNTPVDITLGDITVCNKDGVEFDNNSSGAGVVGMGKLRIQFMEAGEQKSISLDSSIQYRSSGYDTRDTNPDGWGWRDKRTVQLKSGEAIIVNNGLDDPIIFKLKSPIAESAK